MISEEARKPVTVAETDRGADFFFFPFSASGDVVEISPQEVPLCFLLNPGFEVGAGVSLKRGNPGIAGNPGF